MATVDVNTVTLYYERRGDGPPLLFVPGAAGDAGIWDTVVDAFADEFTVVTYDRAAIRGALAPRAGRRRRSRSKPLMPLSCCCR